MYLKSEISQRENSSTQTPKKESSTKGLNLFEYFEKASKDISSAYQLLANFILSEIVGLCNKNNLDISEAKVNAEDVAKLNNYINDEKISMKQAKDVLNEAWKNNINVDDIIKSKNIEQISNVDLLLDEAKKILEKHPKEVQDYKNGKNKLMGFFVGQIMKETQGKANPKALNEILNKLLKGE